jgi:succinyl-CoA synthetase alpha subunit
MTSLTKTPYSRTLSHLKLTSSTRVIFQGFTGRVGTLNARESIAWGTNIVGGVKPGFTGTHLDLPVYPSVREAVKHLKPHATGIYVGAAGAADAVEQALEEEVPLVVAVAEGIPLHRMLRVC